MGYLDASESASVGETPVTDIVSLLRSRAAQKAEATVYTFLADGEIDRPNCLTFAELDHRARAIAARLQATAAPGQRALLLYPPGLEYIEAFFGCLYGGIIAVPAYPPSRQYLARLRAVIADAAPSLIMTTAELAAKFRDSFIGRAINTASGSASYQWLATDTLASDGAQGWQPPALTPDDLAFLQYTSGSTGNPKGVMVSHSNLLANQAAIKRHFGHTEASTVAGWLPLYHDMGLIGNILQPLYLGSSAVLMSPLAFLAKPARWLKAISIYQAATSGGPNFAYDLCVRKISAEQKRDLDLSAWTLAFNGAEPVRAATMERFAQAFADSGFRRESFFPCYGLAEATLFVAGTQLQATGSMLPHKSGVEPKAKFNGKVRPVSCGFAAADHDIRIVHSETGEPCKESEIGEIWVSGPSVAQGYWNRPEESENTFRARLQASLPLSGAGLGKESNSHGFGLQSSVPFLRTGDLGFITDGQLYITGRIKDLIIIRGRNYYPQDIEQTLTERLEALRPDCCAAFGVTLEGEESVVVVAEVTRDARRRKAFEPIIAAMHQLLAEEWELAAIDLVLVPPGAVPKTSSGKLRRSACKQAYENGDLPVLARAGEQIHSSGRASGELIPQGAGQPEKKRYGALSQESVPEFQLLQAALKAVPQAQRGSLIARFIRTQASRLLGVEETALASELPLRSWGLDSLKLVEIKHAADQLLGIEAPLSLFLSDRTLAEVAAALAGDIREQGLEPNGGERPPSTVAACLPSLERCGLSSTQLSMWSVQQLEPNSAVYNLHLALGIEGIVDQELLRQAFHLLVERHGMLRTIYRVEGQGVIQQVLRCSELPPCFTSVDASTWSGAELQNHLAEQVREPFDLSSGPIFRAILYHQGGGVSVPRHTLLLCAHHIAVDLWSVLILVNELRGIYDALAHGRQPALERSTADYAAFAAWQEHYLESPASEKDWDYWRRQLAGELPILALPTDHPRPAAREYRGASTAITLNRDATARLKDLARQQGVTLFTLLLAAYKVLLYRTTHQQDLIVGIPTSGRSQSRFASVVGNFVNPLPLRSHPSGDQPFSVYLAELNDTLLGAMEHQDFPFSLMVERLQPERRADHWPIYQTLFVLQQAQVGIDGELAQLALGEDSDSWNWGDWGVQSLVIEQRVENFDLKLMAAECQDGLCLSFQYRHDLFKRATIARLSRHFETLLRAITADPEVPLGDLPLLSAAERQQILVEWNATGEFKPGLKDAALHRLFETQVEDTPDAVAVIFGNRRLTYGELNARSNRLAHALIDAGVRPDTPVGICARRSLEMVIGLLGILKAGGAYLPLDPDYPPERLSAMVADAQAFWILAQPGCVDVFPDFAGTLWTLDLDKEGHWSEGQPEHNPDVGIDGEMFAYVLFTSGSTGRPKGVGIPHRGIGNRLLWMQDYFRLDASDGVLQKTPYTFDVSVWEFFWPLITGARLILAAPGDHREPERLVGLIERHGVTTLHFVPSMLNAFLEAADSDRCAPLRRVICSGEALKPDLRDRFFQRLQAELHNLYGPTEASVDVTAQVCERELGEASVPIGRPIANTRIHLLDQRLNPVPAGVAGELYIGGVQLARGYLNRPDLTAERFLPDPLGAPGERLYRSGDLARYRGDGVIEYLGRIDHQVKIRGFRIELGEIEARLKQHPGVGEAVVLAREDSPGDKRLVAYVIPSPLRGEGEKGGGSPSSESLQIFLRETLPDYMVPAAFVPLERLPVTANGKLDRKALPAPDFSAQLTEHYVAPCSASEETLAAIWAEVLRVERVGIHDNFFALGGDSILAIQTASRARQAGIPFTPRQLFEHQTVAELAEAAGQVKTGVLDQGSVVGEIPLTPIQRWFFEQSFSTHPPGTDLNSHQAGPEGANHKAALPNPHYWNQAILLEAKTSLDWGVVERAVDHLVLHHDALRVRFFCENGVWRQTALPHESHSLLEKVDLGGVSEADLAYAIEAECTRWQASLNLSDGPLLRVVGFDLGERQNPRLLMVIHHLIVDGVSWRILLEDLERLYSQLSQGVAAVLPPKTSAFKRWAEQLQALAQSEVLRDEAQYWFAATTADIVSLPVDYPEAPRQERDATEYLVELSETETRALLREAPAPYRIGVDDLLHTALLQTICDWCGSATMIIDREGHGREGLFDDIDPSRTVGWFTSMYPVKLQRPRNASTGTLIKAVKEQLSRIPHKGIGYGLLRYLEGGGISRQLAAWRGSQVLFNYLGQLDPVFATAPWRLAQEKTGLYRDPSATRAYELEINAQVSQGRLQVSWRYGAGRYRRETIAGLADRFIHTLRGLIAHCLSPEAGGITPRDFPLAGLSQEALDGLPYRFRDVEDIYPLSPMQEGMLFDTLMAPQSGIYVMQDRFDLRGSIDGKIFRRAWQRMVDRHAALRTSFLWETLSRPCQIVHRRVQLPFEYHDWRTFSPAEQEARLEELLAEERHQGFDFLKPPLMTIRLFRLGEDRYCFIRSYHHILMDAWCMSLMLVELRDSYAALSGGRTPLQSQPPQPRSYIAWLQRRDPQSAKAFWQQYLQGFTEATPLNVDNPVAVGDNTDQGVGDAIAFLSEGDTEKLNALAQQYRLTPNTFIQAAWTLLLSRYSGQEEVLFGVTVSGRPTDLPGSEEMLGVFINTLPLRAAVRAEQSLLDFLQSLLQRNMDIRQHEYTPLVQVQGWSELPREQPLFESLLVFENYPVDPSLRSEEGLFNIVSVDTRTHTNYPLTTMVIPGERLHLQITYYRSRFDAVAVERMLGHFKNLLVEMIRCPERKLNELEMFAGQERRQILMDWNRTERRYPGPEAFAARFTAQAQRTPAASAVACRGEQLTYHELNARAERMANALRAGGVGPETIVVLLADRGVEFLSALLAILKAGAVYLPLDPSHPDGRLAHLVRTSGAALVIASAAYAQRVRQAANSTLVVVTPEELLRTGESKPLLGPRGNPHNLAYILHTSGSTGEPKGVMVEQAGMLNNLLTKVPTLGLGGGDIIAQTASQCFDISVWQFLTPLLCGAKVCIYPDEVAQDPKQLLEAVAQDGVTVLEIVPSLIRAILDSPPIELPRLRWLLPTGEAFPNDLCRRWLERYPHVRLLNAYGPAECSDDVAYYPIPATIPASESSIPIGRPVDNLRLYILDKRLNPVPVGVPGELCVAGIGVGRGYLNKPDLTAKAFLPNLFGAPGERLYRTGDLARYRGDGVIEYLGRIDHQVKVRGFRIELGEIEARLLQHSRVQDAVVVVQETRPDDKRLVAYVVLREEEEGEAAFADTLRGHLRELLPGYMVPAAFVVLEALPLTPNGKVDRKNLPVPEFASSSVSEYTPPRNGTEEILINIWREILEIDRLGIHDNFFELGGHSLLAIQVVSRIRATFDIDIPLRKLFETPTVAALAELIEALLLARLEALSEEEAQYLLAQADGVSALGATVSEHSIS